MTQTQHSDNTDTHSLTPAHMSHCKRTSSITVHSPAAHESWLNYLQTVIGIIQTYYTTIMRLGHQVTC